MRALVTGATGCLGQALCADLAAQGWQIRALSLHGAAPDTPVETHTALDLAQKPPPPALLNGVDVIFHCAALSSAWGPRAAFEGANVTATRHLLDSARAAGVPRFVFASTPSIYITGKNRVDVSEDAALPQHFLTDYARTKYAAETMVRAADGPGFTTVALRPRAIYGPHDRALMPRLLRAMHAGPMPLIGGGNALIDPTYCSDAAQAMRLAASAPGVGGRVFNITSGQAVPLRELLVLLADALHLPLRTRTLPYGLAMTMARVFEATHRLLRPSVEPVLTRHAAAALGLSLTLDISAARRDLGYRPRVSLGEGLRKLAALHNA